MYQRQPALLIYPHSLSSPIVSRDPIASSNSFKLPLTTTLDSHPNQYQYHHVLPPRVSGLGADSPAINDLPSHSSPHRTSQLPLYPPSSQQIVHPTIIPSTIPIRSNTNNIKARLSSLSAIPCSGTCSINRLPTDPHQRNNIQHLQNRLIRQTARA